jgi:hypothetical protein
MRRLCCVSLFSALVASVFTAAVASPARGQAAADDVSVAVGLQMSPSPGVTTSLNFKIFVEVASSAGAEQRFTATIGLPAGLRWGADGPDPSEGCTGTQPAVCNQQMQRNQAGTIGGGWSWDVIAERGGFYEITAAVQPERPDPNPSNNTATFRFEVRQPTSGGGRTTSAAVASAVKLVPAKPRAGSVVAASVRVSAGGTRLRPSKIRCVGTVGSVRLKGISRAGSGIATCRYRFPKAAKGKTFRGTISFTARGKSFTKRFAARLA